jgi:hypothetical protein
MWTHCCSNMITKTTQTIPNNLKHGRYKEGFQWNFKWHNVSIVVRNSYVGIVAVSS